MIRQEVKQPDDKTNPDLVIAQYKSLARQAPLIYGIGLIGGWSLALSHWNVAPFWAVFVYPLLVTIVSAVRVYTWVQVRKSDVTYAVAKRQLDRSHVMAIVVPILFGFWGFSLFPYGDMALQGHVIFTVCVGTVSVMFCVLHLRSAMLVGVIFINLIGASYFLIFQDFTHLPLFISSVIFCIALSFVFRNYYDDFIELVQTGRALKIKQSELELKAAETQRLAGENEKLANHDPLTGLPNRRLFFSTLQTSCVQANKAGNVYGLCIFDLGGFKALNDLFGHVAGDNLLVQVAKRLKEKAGGEFISRLGGDEFCYVVNDAANAREVELKCRQIMEIFKAPFLVPGGGVSLSGYAGVAVLAGPEETHVELYENAAFALKVAKRTPEHGFVLFGDPQRQEMEQTIRLERTLLNANLAKEMTLEYQPIVDIHSYNVRGFEGLARWDNPELGRIPPSSFIPVAEHSGYINQLTGYLMERALKDARNWPDEVSLSFNLSPTNLSSKDFVSQLLQIVDQSGFDPNRLEFEITETAVMWDFDQALLAVQQLKEKGVRISLDDFGTGYSSLKFIHELPLDKIKVDRSFVRDINTDQTRHGIVKSLLTLSHDMNIDCVIEGVETDAELEIIRKIGGELVQGYLLGKPMKPADIPACLKSSGQRQKTAWVTASAS